MIFKMLIYRKARITAKEGRYDFDIRTTINSRTHVRVQNTLVSSFEYSVFFVLMLLLSSFHYFHHQSSTLFIIISHHQSLIILIFIIINHLQSSSSSSSSLFSLLGFKHIFKSLMFSSRLLVERLLNTCLVPYQLPPEDRMKKLFYLYATIDDNASKAFIELQKHQLAVRKNVAELIELHRKPQDEERDREIAYRLGHLTKFLPDPLKVQEFLRKFSQHLNTDSQLLSLMETVVSHDVSCKDSVDAVVS